MATAYQVRSFQKKPSGNPLPKRGQIKAKILSDVVSAIIGGSRKEQEEEEEGKVTIGWWATDSPSQGSSPSSKALGQY